MLFRSYLPLPSCRLPQASFPEHCRYLCLRSTCFNSRQEIGCIIKRRRGDSTLFSWLKSQKRDRGRIMRRYRWDLSRMAFHVVIHGTWRRFTWTMLNPPVILGLQRAPKRWYFLAVGGEKRELHNNLLPRSVMFVMKPVKMWVRSVHTVYQRFHFQCRIGVARI